MPRQQKDQTYDHAHLMKDAGAVTAAAAAQVGGEDRVLDLGAGRIDGRVIVDVSALTVSTDERYDIELQLLNVDNEVVIGATLVLGEAAAAGNQEDSVPGRYELHVTNEVNGVIYPKARLFTRAAGTAESINYTAFLALHG